jgi:hypothetical protein
MKPRWAQPVQEADRAAAKALADRIEIHFALGNVAAVKQRGHHSAAPSSGAMPLTEINRSRDLVTLEHPPCADLRAG